MLYNSSALAVLNLKNYVIVIYVNVLKHLLLIFTKFMRAKLISYENLQWVKLE